MDTWQYKLFEDESGVRHWRYRLAGLLLVCGSGRRTGRDLAAAGAVDEPDAFPTCLFCVEVMAREERR